MVMHRRIILKHLPSSPPSRPIATMVVLLYLTITALIPQNAQAYVTYELPWSTYIYPSVAFANMGEPILESDQFNANMFVAPITNMDMCINDTLSWSHSASGPNTRHRNRRVVANTVKNVSSLHSKHDHRHGPIEISPSPDSLKR